MSVESSFSQVFASALRGAPTTVSWVGDWIGDGPRVLPVSSWTRPADEVDRALVGLCEGPTIDIGCGPGRLTEALAEAGHPALGIDVVDAVVTLARERGVVAVRRDVFDHLPGEGRWESALLADGNIGIGGDPVALLRRVRSVLGPGGRVVAEVAGPGTRSVQGWAVLEGGVHRCRPFRWAVVGMDDVTVVAADAGLVVVGTRAFGDRWAVVLEAVTR
jgi:SAM-dependent methyltransferase